MISSAFFLYGDIQWGEAAQIGFNAGDGISSLSLPGALTEDTVNIEEQSNVGHPGIFAYRIDGIKQAYLLISILLGYFTHYRSDRGSNN